jgi:hypothetical protein
MKQMYSTTMVCIAAATGLNATACVKELASQGSRALSLDETAWIITGCFQQLLGYRRFTVMLPEERHEVSVEGRLHLNTE